MKESKPNSSKGRKRLTWGIGVGLFLLVLLALTQDIIMTNILAYRLCKEDPNPKTFIKKTVEYPESVYFEDNIYPGYDEKDRLLMIINYLDGVHLTTMALNGPEGTVYIFSATPADWQRSSGMKKVTQQDYADYRRVIDEEAKGIAKRGKIVSRQDMPQLKYKVVYNPVSLTDLESKYFYSDEVSITDNLNGEVIGYNRRLMRFWYTIAPDIALGNRYYYPKSICGYSSILGFVYEVFSYLPGVNSGAIMESYNSKLQRKLKSGGLR